MNEQIKKIAEKANIRFGYHPEHPQIDTAVIIPSDLEKLIELLVQECVKELRYEVLNTQECRTEKSTEYQVGYEDGMFEAGETIKEHFGVK